MTIDCSTYLETSTITATRSEVEVLQRELEAARQAMDLQALLAADHIRKLEAENRMLKSALEKRG